MLFSQPAKGTLTTSASKGKGPAQTFTWTQGRLLETLQQQQKVDPDELIAQLHAHKDRITLVLDFYKPPSDGARQQIRSEKVPIGEMGDLVEVSSLSSNLPTFVLKTGTLLDLDEVQTFEMTYSCLSNLLATPSTLRGFDAQKVLEDNTLELRVMEEYLQQRRQTLDLVQALLVEAAREDNPSYEPVKEFLDGEKSMTFDGEFVDRLLNQLERAFTKQVTFDLKANSGGGRLWAMQYLKEQLGLLELLFLRCYEKCPPAAATKIIRTLTKFNFGREQPNRPLFDPELLQLQSRVSNLSLLVALEVMNLEPVINKELHLKPEKDATMVAESAKALSEISDVLGRCQEKILTVTAEPDVRGAVFLAWWLMLMALNNAPGYLQNDVFQRIGQLESMQLRIQHAYGDLLAIPYLLQVLETEYDGANAIIMMARKGIVKGLMMLLCTMQNATTLPGGDILVRCFSRVFDGAPQMAEQFWLEDYPIAERRSLLEATRAEFPARAGPLLELLRSLAGNEAAATFVFRYFKALPTFMDRLREEDYVWRDGSDVAKWRGTKGLVAGSEIAFSPPEAISGKRVRENDVLLRFYYSGWHLFPALLDSFLHQYSIDFRESDAVQGTPEILGSYLKLFTTVLQNGDVPLIEELLTHLDEYPGGYPATWGSNTAERFVGMISALVNQCCTFQQPPMDLLTSCMSALSCLLYHIPTIVWNSLRTEVLFPRHLPAGHGQFGNSYMEQVLLPAEISSGTYSTTLAFLDLVIELVKDAQSLQPNELPLGVGGDEMETEDSEAGSQGVDASMGGEGERGRGQGQDVMERDLRRVKAEVLYSSVVYIHREIFPTYSGWRYVRISDKIDIGLKILQIFNMILRDTTWVREDRRANVPIVDHRIVAEYLYQQYLMEGSLYQVSPLLDVVGFGVDEPGRYDRRQRVGEARAVEQSIKEALILVKRLLTWAKVNRSNVSLLEHALLDRTIKQGSQDDQDTVELVYIIASYVTYEHDIEVAMLGTEVLTLICAVAADWEPRPPSLVGYLGAQQNNIVDGFLRHISGSDNIRNPRLEWLQTAIFKFIAVVLRSQPGLAVLFLSSDQSGSREGGGPAVVAERSMFSALVGILKDWRYLVMEKWRVLPAAAGVLNVLWQSAPDYPGFLNRLRADPTFWTSVESILEYDIQSDVQQPMPNDEVAAACCLQQLQAHALRILALEIYFAKPESDGSTTSQPSGPKLDAKIASIFKTVLRKSDGPKLFMNGQPMPHDPTLTEQLLAETANFNPPLDVSKYLLLTWSDEYSGERQFGFNYLYDFSLVVKKLERALVDPDKQRVYDFVRILHEVNWNWSYTDAYMQLFRSWSTCVKVGALRLDAKAWPKAETEMLFSFATELAGTLAGDVRGSESMLTHRADLGDLLEFVVADYCRRVRKEAVTAEGVERLATLLEVVLKAMRTDEFQCGAVGYFSVYDFHKPLLSAGLVVLRALQVVRFAVGREEEDVLAADKHRRAACRAWVEMLAASMGDVLVTLANGTCQETSRNVVTLLSLLAELVRPHVGLHVSEWLPDFERHRVIPLLLDVFQKAVSVPLNETPTCAEETLLLLVELAQYRPVAEKMVAHGAIAAFCNNSLSPAIMDGLIQPYINVTRNPWHQVWCLMLSVVSSLLQHLGERPQVLRETHGFARLYQEQIRLSINFPAIEGWELTLGGLNEMMRVADLFYGLAKWVTYHQEPEDGIRVEVGDLDWACLDVYQDLAKRVLAYFVHLLNSPYELGSNVVVKGKEGRSVGDDAAGNGRQSQKGQGSGGGSGSGTTTSQSGGSDGSDGNSNLSPAIMTEVRRRMLLVLRSIMSFLRIGSDAHLTTKDHDKWDQNKLNMFLPSMRSQGLEPTMGTLLDLSRHMAAILKTLSDAAVTGGGGGTNGKGKAPAVGPNASNAASQQQSRSTPSSARTAVLIAEAALVIMASQLGLQRAIGGDWESVENEVVGDFQASVEDMVGLLNGAQSQGIQLDGWGKEEIGNTVELVASVRNFMKREKIGRGAEGSSGGPQR
ncbi:hypothetical protein HDV00_011600 [Rhizophlyctis rosea]|nr:hypothetical protein HDV00_011600 [Rhizophlyctis rosea]